MHIYSFFTQPFLAYKDVTSPRKQCTVNTLYFPYAPSVFSWEFYFPEVFVLIGYIKMTGKEEG